MAMNTRGVARRFVASAVCILSCGACDALLGIEEGVPKPASPLDGAAPDRNDVSSSIEIVATDESGPLSVALDEAAIYWLNTGPLEADGGASNGEVVARDRKLERERRSLAGIRSRSPTIPPVGSLSTRRAISCSVWCGPTGQARPST
jgi:hypothetical protein